jgi:hypothetical protein
MVRVRDLGAGSEDGRGVARLARRMYARGMSVRALRGLTLVPLLLAACQPEPPALRVGELAFSAEQVGHLPPERREELADLAALSEAVREQRLEEVVAPIAERQATRERLRWLGRALAAHRLGEEEIARRYARQPERELRVRHVLRLAERGAPAEVHEEARRTAEEVRQRAVAGDSFAELAARFSQEPGAERREGLLDWGRQGDWVEPFWEAAAALTPGEVSPVVRTVYGYHVLLLEEERPLRAASLSPAALLRRTVGEAEAERELAAWASGVAGRLTPHPPALLRAQRALAGGEAAPDSLPLASWPGGGYVYWDLLKDLALLDLRERQRRIEAAEAEFGEAVIRDARQLMWLDLARQEGVSLPSPTPVEARAIWTRRLAGWSQALGPLGGEPQTAPERVLRALAATGQEARLARMELTAVRFRLRELYPPSPSNSASE